MNRRRQDALFAFLVLAALTAAPDDVWTGTNPISSVAASSAIGAVWLLVIWHSQRDKERLRKWLERMMGIESLEPEPAYQLSE